MVVSSRGAALAAVACVPLALWFLLPGLPPPKRDDNLADFLLGEDEHRATSFPEPAPDECASESDAEAVGAQELRPPVLVLYGTEFGFAREIAQKCTKTLQSSGLYHARSMDMADFKQLDLRLESEQVVLLVCSTQGDGVPPIAAREFYDVLHASEHPEVSHMHYSVLALGDSTYTHFCNCGKKFDSRLRRLGAKCLLERVDVDKEDWDAINAWTDAVEEALPTLALVPVLPPQAAGGAGGAAAAVKWDRRNPFSAALVKRESLCSTIDPLTDKETVHLEFDLRGSGIE
jgi:sulfite reductase (NADPH) flavoprotein alpha-component